MKMKRNFAKTFSSFLSRFRLVCSLVYGSIQLLFMSLKLIQAASRRAWQNHTKLHQQQKRRSTNIPLPQQQETSQLTDLEDAELTREWLKMLDEPFVLSNCTNHIQRCYDSKSFHK